MMEGEKVKELLGSFLRDWKMEALSAEGHFDGLVMAWNPNISFQSIGFYKDLIATELEDPETEWHFSFFNAYGPFQNRRQHWETLDTQGALYLPNLILEGDLNLTISVGEFWGKKRSSIILRELL